jgi:hypothetical protein
MYMEIGTAVEFLNRIKKNGGIEVIGVIRHFLGR